MIKSKFVCIIGVDGVGKTTHVKRLLARMKEDGIRCRYTWFRFYHFISLILLAYCRLAGFTIYETKNEQKIGRHEFYRSKMISFLYPWLLLIDMIPLYLVKVFLPLHFGYAIISDRYIYDTLVDLMIDLNNFNIHRTIIGKFFLKLVPKDTKIILLDLNESLIRKRRMDLLGDKSLEARKLAYCLIAEEFKIPNINNDGEIIEVHERILSLLERD